MTKEEKFLKVWNSPILFIENFMKLPDKKGKVVPFKMNYMQKEFMNDMDTYNIILKARQGGMSVAIAALAIYYCITESNCNCLMLSHTDESTRTIFNKLKIIYKSIPDCIKPKLERNNRAELAFTNGSVISCHTMGKRDVGRGSTLKLIHVSEFGFVGDQAETQLLSLEQALRPDGHLIIESTANGLNYFNQVYNKAKSKENSYKAFFYNYLDTACMFKDEHKKFKKIWKNINNREFTEEDLTDEEQELMKLDSRFNLDIILWRRLKIQNAGIDKFNQEFPLTDLMAFITTGSQVFDSKRIDSIEKYIIQKSEKYIPKSNIVNLPLTLQNHYGRSFFIYEIPKSNMRYWVGVDCSEGIGQDSSCCIVLDKDGKEVAMFKNNKIKPYEFAGIVNDIGRYYNKALLTIEKASGGHSVIERLRYDYKYMNMHKYKTYDEFNRERWQVGFDTNNKTKSIIVNDCRELFETGHLQINSKDILEEMKVFSISDTGKMGAISGRHDDLIISLCLAIAGMKSPFYYGF